MRWTHNVVTPGDPASVIDLASIKADLDVTFNDDDDQLEEHRASAIDFIERHTNRFLSPTVVDIYLDCFGGSMLTLPFAPLQSFSTMTVAGSPYTPRTIPGDVLRLLPVTGQQWPSVATELGVVVVRATFGYATGMVPAGLLAAIKALVRTYYDRPEGASLKADSEAIENALRPYRVRSL
jgi:hypothetical protein